MDELHRREKLAPVAERWRARARSFAGCTRPVGCDLACKCSRCEPDRKRRYALARAVSVESRITPRLAACGLETIPIACQCGRRDALVRCRQWWLCGDCQLQRAAERKPRIEQGLRAALERETEAWGEAGAHGMRPRLVLLTLTAPHTGDLVADRAVLSEGWRRFYKLMHVKWGRFPYVGFWEVTPGRCGDCAGYRDLKPNSPRKRCTCTSPKPEGHVHAHVVCVWRFRDYATVKTLWRRALKNASAYMNIVPQRRDGKPSSARSAAKYLAKYVSKGVQGDAFTPRLRAGVSAAFYNAHAFMTSHRFWIPREHRCRTCKYLVRRVNVIDPHLFDLLAPTEHYFNVRRYDPWDRAGLELVINVYPHEQRTNVAWQ